MPFYSKSFYRTNDTRYLDKDESITSLENSRVNFNKTYVENHNGKTNIPVNPYLFSSKYTKKNKIGVSTYESKHRHELKKIARQLMNSLNMKQEYQLKCIRDKNFSKLKAGNYNYIKLDVNIKDTNGTPALNIATKYELLDFITFLVEKGANVNCTDK